MAAQEPVDAEYYRALLRPVFRDQRFVLIGAAVHALAALGRELQTLGAESFLLGSAMGLGTPPEEFPWQVLGVKGRDQIDAAWRYEAMLGDLPGDVLAELDAWDPERRARAAGSIVLSDVPEVGGRARFGRRPAEWAALEDKTRVHEFLDGIGVRRGPLAVVRARAECLRAAHSRVDRGAGTVLAGDATPGVHGGATYVRPVHDSAQLEAAASFFGPRCERVRIMPFVEGVPCSVHGLVFSEGVAVFRPVELVTLRAADRARFVYAGTATFWDPPEVERVALRALARQVAHGLREHVGYRGPFTLDGVLGANGFVPTELNARMGAGFQHLQQACPELPLGALALAAQNGEALDYRPDALEAIVLQAADAHRTGSGRLHLAAARGELERLPIVRDAGRYRRASAHETSDAALLVGPGQVGSFVAFAPDPADLAAGASFAPEVCAAFAAADRELGTQIGALTPAREA
jgi:hypothetical protein